MSPDPFLCHGRIFGAGGLCSSSSVPSTVGVTVLVQEVMGSTPVKLTWLVLVF